MPGEAGPHPVPAGILLAAGTASRMGHNKLLLTLEGETVLRRAARRALAAGLSPLFVVLGHQAERARPQLDGLGCEVVLNPHYERGMGSSLRAGIAALPDTVPAAVVVLADMPFVTPEMIAALVARYRASGAPLVVSDYEGVQAPPMLYDRSLFGEVMEMTGDGGGKRVLRRHHAEAQRMAWPASALHDLDLPEDYERVHSALGGH